MDFENYWHIVSRLAGVSEVDSTYLDSGKWAFSANQFQVTYVFEKSYFIVCFVLQSFVLERLLSSLLPTLHLVG